MGEQPSSDDGHRQGEGGETPEPASSRPEQRPEFRQRKTQLITAMMGVSLINGMLTSRLANVASGQISPLDLAAAVVIFALGFWWLHLDGRETGARRTPLFNVGIVLLAIVFVPLYFVNARPPGRRFLPVLGFLGLVIGSSLLATVGATLAGGGNEVF